MALPIAHALLGGSIAVAAWPQRSSTRRALVAGALLGVSPDIDYLLNVVRVFGTGWHHGFTHSALFALVVGAATSWLLGIRAWRGVLVCALAIGSHTALDYLVTESRGVALAWPITDARYKLDMDLSYYRFTSGSDHLGEFVMTSAIELLLFGPILAVTILVTRRRSRERREPPG